MIPLSIKIENFMRHESTFIDFEKFQSACIVGKIHGNDQYSNGVGKTSIFKAIEYALFNQSSSNLEKVIRDDQNSCKNVFKFKSNNEIYEISRTRSRKGMSDLTLKKLNSDGTWKDISGRRSSDTEKQIESILKFNFKAFQNTVHFVQDDRSGLISVTPNNRKNVLKEMLGLQFYAKLEKLAKDNSNKLLSDISSMEKSVEEEANITNELESACKNKESLLVKLDEFKNHKILLNDEYEIKKLEHTEIKNNFLQIKNNLSNFLEQKNELTAKEKDLTNQIETINTKSKLNINESKELTNKLNILRQQKESINNVDEQTIKDLEFTINNISGQIIEHNSDLKTKILKLQELNTPFPQDSVCKHCRQILTEEHKELCIKEIETSKQQLQNEISIIKNKISALELEKSNFISKIDIIKSNLKLLNNIDNQINISISQLNNKKSLHKEYTTSLVSKKQELSSVQEKLIKINDYLKDNGEIKLKELSDLIGVKEEKLNKDIIAINDLNKKIGYYEGNINVIDSNIKALNSKLTKINNLYKVTLKSLKEEYLVYPDVIQAFSSSGIPNLIIQNILESLQDESNLILSKLRPNLQNLSLEFVIEKDKSNGTTEDTLDIKFFVNQKERDENQVSGAEKMCFIFALKLGLLSVLNKINDTEFKLLLLDELDQALDKAGTDTLVEIIKYFQKDFNILVITHNDRLKEKFKDLVVVEQDETGVSRGKLLE